MVHGMNNRHLASNVTEEQVLLHFASANKYPTDYTRLALDIHASFSKYFSILFVLFQHFHIIENRFTICQGNLELVRFRLTCSDESVLCQTDFSAET